MTRARPLRLFVPTILRFSETDGLRVPSHGTAPAREPVIVKRLSRPRTLVAAALAAAMAVIYFLIGLRNRIVVAVSWLWIYLSGQRSARMAT